MRNSRVDALDSILESLGSQVVPPSFHVASSDSSLFGSQPGTDDEADKPNGEPKPPLDDPFPGQSPTETLRNVLRNGLPKHNRRSSDRSKWKTLRDFVDERAIEGVLDTIENDRIALDVRTSLFQKNGGAQIIVFLQKIMARTSRYPEDLTRTITDIRANVATELIMPSIVAVVTSQEDASANMATLLTNLAHHYDQIVDVLHESEAGTVFDPSEIEGV